ncbi:MAG: Rid family hydrolase [Candidatus Woesearchaeota archaeon]|nr:Rid family hydrolase [Candidatus Woesearchaeota archaeon]
MVETSIADLESVADRLIERYNIPGLAPAVREYKHVTAKRIGSASDPTAYELNISGMLALNGLGELVGEDCKGQTLKIINNIATAISHASAHYGLQLSKEDALKHVTDTIVLLKDMGHFPQVNEAYRDGGMPLACRAAFAVKDLPLSAKGVLVEIRANAYLPVPKA